jgi:metacaspase-1
MPKGFSLHIGVNKYDRVSYSRMGFNNPDILPNCDNDAIAKMGIADRFKFNSAILLNEEATTRVVLDGIKLAARNLDYGDIFFLSFSGHGYHVTDRNGDEDDKFDETWCLYDGMIIDDELFEHWKLFRPGVRILVIADCCHSGTSIKDLKKSMSRPGGRFPVEKSDEVQASCLLLSACQDEQSAYAGDNLNNSLYTYWMLKVLERYEFCDSYNELHKRISACMPPSSKPNLFKFGPGADQFARKRPFRI